jgi:hypothetical protein
MPVTKSNGTPLRKHSKKDKVRKIYPIVRLGNFKTNTKNKIIQNNIVCYKNLENKYVKDKIKKVLSYPNKRYVSHQYLSKHTIVLTENNHKIRLLSCTDGHLTGVILTEEIVVKS